MSAPATGPATLADGLLETLAAEAVALGRLRDGFRAQLAAVRSRDHAGIEAASAAAGDVVAELDRHRAARARQTRLLAKVLRAPAGDADLAALAEALRPFGDALSDRLLAHRAALRAAAAEARAACEEVEFALGYAAELSRELIQTLQQHGVGAPTQVYTAKGYAATAAPTRTYLNELG